MKRANGDVVGRPKAAVANRDVAGLVLPSRANEVASFKHALNDRMGTASDDEDSMADFEEFMSGNSSFVSGELPPPDPAFRELLRRRLWLTHVMANLRDGGEVH